MEGQSRIQPTSTESRYHSVVKPVPLCYYAARFERLYQQSPAAKLYRQELTQPPTLKEGRSRHSTNAKVVKLPTSSPKESPTVPPHDIFDVRLKAEEEVELIGLQAGIESGTYTSGTSEFSVSVDDSTTSDCSLDEVKVQVGKEPLLSPQPWLLSYSGQDEERMRKRKPMPNLHTLIKRLKSPVGTGPLALEGFKSSGTKATRVPDPEMTDGSKESFSAPYLRSKDDWQDPCDEDGSSLEATAGSGVSTRSSRRTSSESDPDGMSLPSLKETPIPGLSGKKKYVPQRRLLQELCVANNQDRGHHSPRASERNMLYRMRPADIRPTHGKSVNSDASCQKATSESVSEFVGCPPNLVVGLSEETPVNRGSGRRKTRANGSKLDVGKSIGGLQAGQETREDTPRSEVQYKGKVESNVHKDDKTGHQEEPSSPMGAEESVDVETEGDKEEGVEGVQEETISEQATCRDSTETAPENETGMLTRRQTNKLVVKKKRKDKLEVEEPVSRKPSEVPKKQETIINRWIIKPVPSCKGVCVEGHRVGDAEDQFWHSTVIMVRLNRRLLATKSGSLYRLAGKMDRALTMEQGFSESLIRSFQKGFPNNWRDLLYDYYMIEDDKKAEKKSSQSPWMKKHQKLTPKPSRAEPTLPDSVQKAKKTKQSEVTPQNLRVKDLRRSSSGRLIKPPLAYWTGQRIRHNTSLDFVEILLGTEDGTSSSVNKISLQDSLELGAKEKRVIKRTSITSKLQPSSAVKKQRQQQRNDDGEESLSCPDPGSLTDVGESQNVRGLKLSATMTKSKRSKEAGIKRQVRGASIRPKATTTDSSEGVDVPGKKIPASKIGTGGKPSVFALKGQSRYQQRSRRNAREPRIDESGESCSSDYPGEATDDTASTCSTNPVDCSEGNGKHARKVIPPSHGRGNKQPPTPKKDRPRREMQRASSRPSHNAPVSPLYFSPQSEEGSLLGGQPTVGKTPTSNRHNTGNASSSTLGPSSSSDPGQTREISEPGAMNMEHEKDMSSEIGGTSGVVGTLNLQKEVLAVVEKHKQGRMARMRKQTLRLSASSDRELSNDRKLPSTSDVYELSEDEEPKPRSIPYIPYGASTNTTTAGESVSNWSEEGDKSLHMTWVTRGKPSRRFYGTSADTRYLTDETTTTTGKTTDTTTVETDSISNLLSSARETSLTETSDDEDVLRVSVPTKRRKKSVGTRLKSKTTRQGYKPVLDQTSDDKQIIQSQKPVSSRSSKRTMLRHVLPEASSEDTDSTPRVTDRAIFLRLQPSSGDTDATIKAEEESIPRGRIKKAIVIQRRQPKRNCKKSGTDSDTDNPQQDVEKTWNHRRSEPVPPSKKDNPKQMPQKIVSEHRNQDTGRKSKSSKSSQGVQLSNCLEANEKRIRDMPRREVNGNSDFIDVARDEHPTLESVPSHQCAAKSSTTKPSQQQSEQQENQAQVAVALTGKVGTMKRKRQLRELVEQHNRGYEDDIFDSTPFKKQKKLKIPLGEWDIDEDSQEGPTGKTPGSARFKTPSVRYQGMLPLSDKKTPYSNLISPGLLPSVDRKHIDQYIYGLQKKKKGRGLTQRSDTAKQPTNVGRIAANSGKASLTQAMGDKASDLFDVIPVSDSDPDEDRDYYWSDEEH